ncbi:hypothetical protein BJ322DRAFT_626928 [Thelephora terrestris]|uniref:Uncharacterized protein n=1 Tax=Thelephora terrestris TaxID=56493 RepID=A0A9P6HJM3_9AGAM|nr:hypothetical protein BJ322DRAFT_626928 [Thelephora terrestris]
MEGYRFLFSLFLPRLKMSVEGANPSLSPSRGLRASFSEQITDIKTKLARALSSERPSPHHDGSSQYSQLEDNKVNANDRSLSRGRDAVQSFGRGGFGNMRSSSTSRGPEDREISLERGRGATRIPPSDGIESVPEDTLPDSAHHSTGRGGYANITDIRSPDIEPPVHVTHPDHERVSTGRGGAGNIRDRSQSKVRDQPEPHLRRPHPEPEVFSSGRGGAGNIRSRSQSKPPKDEKVRCD